MKGKKKTTYWLIGGVLLVFIIGGYFSYLDVEHARNNGVYTIAYVNKIRPARNGWKVKTHIYYNDKLLEFEHLVFWETFSIEQNKRRLFAKISIKNSEVKLGFIYSRSEVPDSIKSAPSEGWSEEWMYEHFPEVVEYVHDTK